MQIKFVGEDDSRLGFKHGDVVEVNDGCSFPRDFRKVEEAPPSDPPVDTPPADVPPADETPKEGE